MRLTAAIIFGVLLYPLGVSAASPKVRLSSSFAAGIPGSTLTMVFEPRSTSGDCTYLLYGAASSSHLRGSFRRATLLGQFSGGSSTYIAQGTGVASYTRLRRGSKTRKLHFRAVAFCGSRVIASNTTSLKIPRIDHLATAADDATWFGSAIYGFRVGTIELRRVFGNLTFNEPIDLQNAADNRLYVAEKSGRIFSFLNDNATTTKNAFLDISATVDDEGEQGLLGFAFHPQHFANRYVFVHYTQAPGREATISRFTVDPSTGAADPASEFVLLQIPPTAFSNHKGGQIAFGTDGKLYIAIGDGGGGGDPLAVGQDTSTLLGKVLRIDVDNTSGMLNYAIPADNPFVGQSGVREEIYAYGLRNPFRMSFDSITSLLWLGDVGQGAFEEIDIVESGKNYGWNIMEGAHCFSPSSGCNQTGLTLPLIEYPHNGSGRSVTGGHVYRGTRIPRLFGKYVYADFIDGRIFTYDPGTGQNSVLFDTTKNWSSFGVDASWNLFLLSYGEGAIYALSPPGGL